MTGRRLGLIAALGSLGMMIAALGFQYIGELPPCKMCYWQRYPHIAAIGIGVLFLFFAYRGLLLLGAFVRADHRRHWRLSCGRGTEMVAGTRYLHILIHRWAER